MTLLEMKNALKSLEGRVASLEGRLASAEKANVARAMEAVAPAKHLKAKMCPHCGEVPAYFFHVKTCARKQKEKEHGGKKEAP